MQTDNSQWWLYNLGRRIWLAGQFILWPLQVIALLCEIALAGVFLGIILILIAWWKHMIPQADIVWFVDEVGKRGLSILKAQGVYHIGKHD